MKESKRKRNRDNDDFYLDIYPNQWKACRGNVERVEVIRFTGKTTRKFKAQDGLYYHGCQYLVRFSNGDTKKVFIREPYIETTDASVKVNVIDYSADSLTCSPEACAKNDYRVDSESNSVKLKSLEKEDREKIRKINTFAKDKSLSKDVLEGFKRLKKLYGSLLSEDGLSRNSVRKWQKWKDNNKFSYDILCQLMEYDT